MNESRHVLLGHLARAARARRWRRASRHAAAALSLVGGLLATAILVLAVAPALRPWMLVALASVFVVGLGMFAGALLRRESPMRTAEWIARREPALGGAIADAVEFSGRFERREAIPTGSAELARAHVEDAARRAAQDDPARHALRLPAPPWRAAWSVLGAAALALLLVPGGRRVLLFGPPPPAPPRVAYGAVQLTYRHPAYLHLPDRVETGAGDVEAPVGTHVDVLVRADRDLASARLEPSEGAAIEMKVDAATATGTLVVTKSGTYRIVLRGARGEIDPDSPVHVLRAIADEPPTVRLRSPRTDVALSEGDSLPVEWLAEDDHGVAEVALVLRSGSSDEDFPAPGAAPTDAAAGATTRLPLGTFDPPEADKSGAQSFTTKDLGLIAGDRAWLWVEARDDDAVTGPKWDASSRIQVVVRSEEEQESALDRSRQELGETLLALLASHVVAPPAKLTTAAAVAAHHREFAPKLQAAATLAGEVADQAQSEQQDFTAASALQEMRTRLDSAARSRARREDALLSGDAERARTAHADLFDREVSELERDVLFFDMWADRRASLRASDTAEELLTAARELREMAERKSPEARAEDLLASERDVSSSASSLEEKLQQLAQAAGADPAAAAEARALLSALQEQASGLEKKLSSGDRSSARRDAQRLEQMAGDLADRVSDLADAGASGDPELAREMEKSEADLRRLRRDQADLRDETNRLRDEARKALSPEDLERAQEGFAELEKLATEAVDAHARGEAELAKADAVSSFFRSLEEHDRAESRLRELLENGGALDAAGAQELERLRDQLTKATGDSPLDFDQVENLMRNAMNARELLGRTKQAISDRDLASARGPARWALDQLRGVDAELEEGGPLSKARPDFTTAEAKTSELIQKLEDLESQLEQSAQQALTSAQREQLRTMGQREGEMQQRARSLAAKLRELSADAPFLDEGVASKVDEAGGFMDQATQGLFGRQPGSASENQGEALAKLDDAADAMSPTGDKQDGRQRGGSRGKSQDRSASGGRERGGREGGEEGRSARMGRTSRERVEIPDADDFKVPKEFREEILEAMRESAAPDGYAEQVREYYRRLVE